MSPQSTLIVTSLITNYFYVFKNADDLGALLFMSDLTELSKNINWNSVIINIEHNSGMQKDSQKHRIRVEGEGYWKEEEQLELLTP